MGFVLHNDPSGVNAVGQGGGGFGALGIQNGLAIQFDTYQNSNVGDIANEVGAGSIMHIPAGVEHYIEPTGTEPVMNLDVFAPARADYMHLLEASAALTTDARGLREGSSALTGRDLDVRRPCEPVEGRPL